uniref:Uncharacterized protein n=1 Tax=Sinocyclocheilus rhinocerous TaxID=307959 RepID=A0A673FUD8_9TELE
DFARNLPDFGFVNIYLLLISRANGEDYEVRTYHTTNWVSTAVTGMEQDPALSTGFRRLFKYIQGNNDKNEYFQPLLSHFGPVFMGEKSHA